MIYDAARWSFPTINYQMMGGDCRKIILTLLMTNPSLVYDHQKARPDNLPAIFDFTNHFNKWFHLYKGQCHKIILNCSSSFSKLVKKTTLVCRHFIRLSLQCSECVLISPDIQYLGYWRHSDTWMTRRVARARQ